jgi:hypothetical protein
MPRLCRNRLNRLDREGYERLDLGGSGFQRLRKNSALYQGTTFSRAIND